MNQNHLKLLCAELQQDALGCKSEPEMVGIAAAQFTADWESGQLRLAPPY